MMTHNFLKKWACTIQSRLKNPPVSFDDYLEILLKQGLPTTVSMLRQFQGNEG